MKTHKKTSDMEEWEREIASFDRQVRKLNQRRKQRMIRLDASAVSIIGMDRKLNLTMLNELSARN